VDLAGGTLDCWPLYVFTQGAFTLNLAIDIYTRAELEPHSGPELFLDFRKFDAQLTFSSLKEALASTNPQMDFLKPHLHYWAHKIPSGFSLKLDSESPVGAGLGGSSSLCISILKVFAEWLNEPIDPHSMVRLASHLEAECLMAPTGTQDYVPPLAGGLNVIRYDYEDMQVKTLCDHLEIFGERLLLFYTGQPHHSGINNFEVLQRAVAREPKTLQALRSLKDIAGDMKETVEMAKWDRLPELWRREYAAREELSEGFLSDGIRQLRTLAFDRGGEAVKICGAGGGGCVFVWAPPERHEEIIRECQKQNFQHLPVRPVAEVF